METREIRLKRLQMRSMRRGMKEMDIILSGFASDHLEAMPEAEILLYDTLLSENDQDLYTWVVGQVAAPDQYAALIAAIARHASAR